MSYLTAVNVLKNHQKQIDADGNMVGVSRQALDEVLNLVDELDSVLTIYTLNNAYRNHIVRQAVRIDELEVQNLEMQSRIDELCPPPSDEFQAVLDSIPQIK